MIMQERLSLTQGGIEILLKAAKDDSGRLKAGL
jgi:hypothetical protein